MNYPPHDHTMQDSGFFPAVLLIALCFCLLCGCLHSGEDSRDWNTKGETYHSLGRYEEAIAAFDHAVALDPENGEAWRNRGLSLSQLNRSAEAEESFSSALEINPSDSEAYYFRALSLDAAGNITGALESTDRAVTIMPKSHDEPQGARGNDLDDMTFCRMKTRGPDLPVRIRKGIPADKYREPLYWIWERNTLCHLHKNSVRSVASRSVPA
jgi:tetratricopeptide (TPR) repeat protein